MILTPVFLISLIVSVVAGAMLQRRQQKALQALRRERVLVRVHRIESRK